jgi:hypothetical protein
LLSRCSAHTAPVAKLELEISPPPVTPPVEEGVEELLDEIRALGHEPTIVLGHLEFSAEPLPFEVVIRLAERLADESIVAIVGLTVAWIRRVVRGRRARRPDTVRLYGPDGEVLQEVEVDPDDGEDK